MSTAVGQSAYPTAAEIRDQILRDLSYYGDANGIVYNVRPGSDYYKLATSLANRCAVAIANNKISNDERNPLLATGDNLRELARVYGIEERPASGSSGDAIVRTSATATPTIPAGWRSTAPNGKKYDVVFSATVSNGDIVTISSVDTGAATELAAGTKLTWDSAAIATLLNPLTVGVDGIVGGVDADTDETIRNRLVDRLAAQALGGNASSIKEWAEEISAAVDRAYVYQALQGPGSLDFAITRAAGDRALPSTIVAESKANVEGQMPGGVIRINATSVEPEDLDVVFSVELPPSDSSAGGWRDASPWPSAVVKVTGIAGATLTIDSTTQPPIGNTIGLWNRSGSAPVMEERRILTRAGVSGAYDITVDGSVSFVETGDLVSAGAMNLVGYADKARSLWAELGPGEKTTDPDLLPRSLRFPSPDIVSPCRITSRQVTEIQADYPEIIDLELTRCALTGTLTDHRTPSLPPTTADAPRILVLKNIAFIVA